MPAPLGIELREHVVEQKEWRHPAPRGDRLGLGEEEREEREPLLSLRAEAPQVAVGGGEEDVVEVRPERRRAPLEIARRARASSASRVGGSPS